LLPLHSNSVFFEGHFHGVPSLVHHLFLLFVAVCVVVVFPNDIPLAINQEGEKIFLEDEANQIAQTVSSKRVVITAGQFSLLDVFDDSRYAKDPRTQFLNWGNLTYLAYDYAADARGYSWGLAGEWYLDHWVMRASRMLAPKSPNGRDLNWQIFNTYGDQVEVERQHNIANLPGKVSVLAYRNKMMLARFSDATNFVIQNNAQGTQAINNGKSHMDQ
jgi:hypothetical protein